jgi:transcriptional regulator with XRE-family HTH domain
MTILGDPNELSDLLRKRRGERSLRSVADELAVDSMTIRAWEEGFKRPKAERAEAIGEYLGIPTIDVLVLMGVLPESAKSA